jgi:hypothetical protein
MMSDDRKANASVTKPHPVRGAGAICMLAHRPGTLKHRLLVGYS